jgi:hypothetical protein
MEELQTAVVKKITKEIQRDTMNMGIIETLNHLLGTVHNCIISKRD